MTTTPKSYSIQFKGNDILFVGFVHMQVVARAEFQDGAWLLIWEKDYRDVGYADSLQEVMDWANNNFNMEDDED